MITLRVHFSFLKQIVIPIFLLVGATSMKAQMRLLTGTVASDEGESLIGVNIVVQDAIARGAITDIDGNYSIEIQKGETLIFSYTGFEDQKVQIRKSNRLKCRIKSSSQCIK